MGKRNHRKLQKKRKADRKRRHGPPVALAYRGRKYQTEELVPLLFDTEIGIYECFVMTERRLTDYDVWSALQKLILQIRNGLLTPGDDLPECQDGDAGEVELLIWNIRGHWQNFFQTEPYPGRDKMIGMLRTTLGSIEVWGAVNRNSRGYLRYIEEFLKEGGVSVNVYSSESELMRAIE